jgi:DNA (cytosine-5)-methyltransferase 1
MAGIGPEEIDLVVGGPPCQGFSIQRIGEDKDTRNNLVLTFGQLVAEFHPRMFLMENVPGLLGKRGQALTAAFQEELSKAGYEVEAIVVNAAAYGVAQIRRRVIFAGWRRGEPRLMIPAPRLSEGEYVSVWEAIGDLPPPPKDLNSSDPLHKRSRLSPLNQRRIELIPPGGGMEDLPVDLRVNCHKNGAGRIGHRYVYGRLSPDKPAGTITARFDSFTRGKFGHPKEPRNITLREGARLQSFPDEFKFTGTQEEIASQIGNAVPPLLAETLAHAAAASLKRNPTRPTTRSSEDNSQLAIFGA